MKYALTAMRVRARVFNHSNERISIMRVAWSIRSDGRCDKRHGGAPLFRRKFPALGLLTFRCASLEAHPKLLHQNPPGIYDVCARKSNRWNNSAIYRLLLQVPRLCSWLSFYPTNQRPTRTHSGGRWEKKSHQGFIHSAQWTIGHLVTFLFLPAPSGVNFQPKKKKMFRVTNASHHTPSGNKRIKMSENLLPSVPAFHEVVLVHLNKSMPSAADVSENGRFKTFHLSLHSIAEAPISLYRIAFCLPFHSCTSIWTRHNIM